MMVDMQITLKVGGNDAFHSLINTAADQGFPEVFHEERISWNICRAPSITGGDLICRADAPDVLLIDGNDPALLPRLQSMQQALPSSIEFAGKRISTPVIVVFQSPRAVAAAPAFPDLVCDWTIPPLLSVDLAGRVLQSLRRRHAITTRLHFGKLTLCPDTRAITYNERVEFLTPTECALAELFLGHSGVVIPYRDIVELFAVTGKSTQANNIRVAVFQLRLKLEMLTKSNVTLESVYRCGYCLRQNGLPVACREKVN